MWMYEDKRCKHRYIYRYELPPWGPSWQCADCLESLSEKQVYDAGWDPTSLLRRRKDNDSTSRQVK